MEHFRLFVLPFWVGAGFLLVVLLYKYISLSLIHISEPTRH